MAYFLAGKNCIGFLLFVVVVVIADLLSLCVCGKIYIKFTVFNHFKVNPVVLITFTLL